MKKIILLTIAMVVSIATCSQTAGTRAQGSAGGQPFEVKQSIFFANGTLDEYIVTEWNDTYTRIEQQLRFSASAALIEKIQFRYEGNSAQVTEKQFKDGQDTLKSTVTYQYRDGRLWREVIAEKNARDRNPVTVSTNEYTYDNNGNRTSRIIRNRTDSKQAETTYTYNAQGKITASETKDAANKVINSARYTYDAQSNLVNQQTLNAEGSVVTVINTVWQEGREQKTETATADGTVQLRVTNEYGANGELVKKTIENLQGKSTQIVQYEYVLRPRQQS